MDINYIEADRSQIDMIKPLWGKLRRHVQALSLHFSERYGEVVFEDRKRELLKKSINGHLKIDIVKDDDTKKFVGYCVSSISYELNGEIDSIYVEEEYRSMGIGNELMNRALKWMDKKGVKNKKIVVTVGNDELLSFYKKFDFAPKHTILEQK